MANNTIKFDIKAAVDTGGLDEFVSQLRQLKDVAEPADRVLGDAVKQIKAWADSARTSERNTAAATTAIQALTGAMTAGGNEWKKATQAGNDLNKTLRETVNAANAAKAALAAPARTTSGAGQQIADMRKGLQDLTIGSTQYLTLLQQITEKESLLGRRTGRAGVVAANQAFEGALLTREYGAPDRLQGMPDTTAALRQRLSELGQEFPNVIRGSERYLQIGREMSAIERELAKDLTGTTQALRQRSAATQAKIDAVRAYNEQALRERVQAGDISLAERRRTAFGDMPQAMRTETGAFIAPPYRSSGYTGMGTMYPKPIGPQTALDYFESIKSQYPKPIGPQTPLEFWSSRTSSGAMQGPAAPSDLFRSIYDIGSAGKSAGLQAMGRSYQEVAQQIRDTAQAAGGSTRALEAEKRAWEQLRASVAPATHEYELAGREMQRVDRRLGNSRRGERFLESAGAISAGAFFGGPEGLIGGLAGMAIGGPGAALGGASIGAQVGIVRQAIGGTAEYAAEVGKLRIALRGVLGDVQQYQQALGVIASISQNLNIPAQEATQGFTGLAAAVVGAGGNVNDAEVVFRGVTSAIKATGGTAQDAQSAITALSQVFSKGKVSAEELQGQLGERLPGAVTLFAQATGRTLPQLSKDLEQGTVGLNDLIRFTEALSSKYAANALTIAKSTEDSGARQAVALARLREEFGKTFMPLGASLQNAASSWAEYAANIIGSINSIISRFDGLREAAKTGALALLPGIPGFGPALTGAIQLTPKTFGPQQRLAAAGSTARYSDAQGNVYDTATGKLLMPAGNSTTNFANPRGKNEENERKKAEREERKRQEEAARQQRLDLQLYNDQVRLQEQLAENRIQLEDRVFQYKQELLRREREQLLQLDQLRQQTLIAGFSQEGRSAVAPIQELLQRLQGIQQNRQDLTDQLAAARQELKSAKANAENRQRFGAMYRSEDSSRLNGGSGKIVEHYHGDPSRPGYDYKGHGTQSNAHDHFGFDSEQTARMVMAGLRQLGYTITEFGVRSGHTDGSLHYSNKAFDVPWAQFGSGPIGQRDFERSRKLRADVEKLLGMSGAPATTTLANGNNIRTPGAAAAALRGASAAGDVGMVQASIASIEDQIKKLDQIAPKLADQSVKLSIAQATQALDDQILSLQDNYQEWQIRNRLEKEGVRPELIDFEVEKTRVLNDQARSITALNALLENNRTELEKAFKASGSKDPQADFENLRKSVTSSVSNRNAQIITGRAEFALAAADPALERQRRIDALGQSMRDFTNTQKLAISLSDQLSSNLANGFSNATTAIITGNGSIQQSFADLFNNVAKMFTDTISRVLADKAAQFLLSLIPVPKSSIAPGPVATANGIVPRAGFMGPGFATGGISSGPTSGYPATLHGTEAIVPLPNGRAIPVEMKGSSGTSVVVNVNMATGQSDVQASESDGRALGEALSKAVQDELIKQKRPGGILYR